MTTRLASDRPLIGLVVEGITEYQALPLMLEKLGTATTKPSNFHGQPVEADIPTLAERSLLPHVRVQLAKDVHLVMVVIDFETRRGSAGGFRRRLRTELRRQVRTVEGAAASRKVEVIVCDPMFENWLVADPGGITKSNYVDHDIAKRVHCHADGQDAIGLLKHALRTGESYRKSTHGPRLAQHLRIHDSRVHLCSESLRQFVQIVTDLKSNATRKRVQ